MNVSGTVRIFRRGLSTFRPEPPTRPDQTTNPTHDLAPLHPSPKSSRHDEVAALVDPKRWRPTRASGDLRPFQSQSKHGGHPLLNDNHHLHKSILSTSHIMSGVVIDGWVSSVIIRRLWSIQAAMGCLRDPRLWWLVTFTNGLMRPFSDEAGNCGLCRSLSCV